jgi:glycosyltransferase involved in cell wall biosynthesis
MKVTREVSVVTVTKNSEKYLEQTINSVFKQTYDNITYYIVDGLSTDSTLDIIKKFHSTDKVTFKWISENDLGIYDAMNKGLTLIENLDSFVLFLNSDDYLDSENSIANLMSEIDDEEFSYGLLRIIDKDFNLVIGSEVNLNSLAYKKICYHPTVLAKREIFNRIGFFETSYKIASDYDFFLKVFKNRSIKKIFVKTVVSSMRMTGVSSLSIKKSFHEKKQIIKKSFPFHVYLKAFFFINLYEIPRNNLRILHTKTKLINIWRIIRSYVN